jgi:DNA recombination protein RmuC
VEALLIGIIAALVAALITVILLFLNKRPQAAPDISASIAVLSEKLSHIEPVTQIASSVQVELRGLAERVLTVEHNQSAVENGIQRLGLGLAETSTVATNLTRTADSIRAELSRASEGLTDLRSHARARQELEERTAESIRRLEAIIAGTQSRGAAGENILEALFARLPADWQVRDFRVGDKFVEFGLRLPNNLVLPIDSKWSAPHLLEQLADCDDPEEAQRLKAQIESVTLSRAREVRKYLDPSLTVNFCVAAVPDAVFDLCGNVQVEMVRQNVVLVSYSMFVPYLLLIFQTVLKTSQNLDLEKLDAYLRTAQESIEALQEELEGRFSRAITMLGNSRSEMSIHLGRVRSGLISIQTSASPTNGTSQATDDSQYTE